MLGQSMANQLDLGMYDHYRDVETLIALPPLAQVWGRDRAKMREVLNGIKASRPEFAWIGFAAPDGTVLAASGGLIEGVSVADRPWFRTALAGPMVGDVHEAKLLATLLEDDGTGEPFRFVDIAFPLKRRWPDDRRSRRSPELAMGEHVARARVAANSGAERNRHLGAVPRRRGAARERAGLEAVQRRQAGRHAGFPPWRLCR